MSTVNLPVAVAAAADRHSDPAFRDAIFLDVGLFLPVESDADALAEHVLVEMRAARVERQAIGERLFGLGLFGL